MKRFLIKDLFDIRKGRKERATDSDGIRYIQIEDIRSNDNLKLCEENDKNILVDKNDIVIAWDGANAGIVGFNLNGALGSTLGRLRLKENIDSSLINTHYVGYFLKSKENYIKDTTTGATIPHVSRVALQNIEISLPPISTQNKVVELLNRTVFTSLLRQQQIQALSELKQSIFIDMFGDPRVNNFNFPIKPFTHFADIDTKMVRDFTGLEDLPHIGVGNIEAVTGKILNYETVGESNIKSGKYLFGPEHIIYSKIRPYLNKVATPNFEGVCSADSYPILVNEETTNKEFFVNLLRSEAFLEYINTVSSRTNIPKVNQSQLKNYKGIYPPLDLQNEFSNKAIAIDENIKMLNKSMNLIESMYRSLLHKAFNGELFKEEANV